MPFSLKKSINHNQNESINILSKTLKNLTTTQQNQLRIGMGRCKILVKKSPINFIKTIIYPIKTP